eukprot:TRINITY_DN16500_c0_g1_i1.p1 TRINITY_DN16500_c0_g1~~TRINITY_DN16500_c0_g1_i1.p1  ORF type:complete len:759 (+),score=286.66 TRINITY_DN16500_c0_g1_i1:56-2278(+)
MARRAAVWAVCALAVSGQECMPDGTCKTQVAKVIEDIREKIADRIQSKMEGVFALAPTAVRVTDSKFSDGMLSSDMTNASYEAALLEHFWYQMQQFEDLDWVYFGHDATGSFVSLRRPYQCELAKNCNYGGTQPTGNAIPTVAADTIVRELTTAASGHTMMQAWPTAKATGSDPIGTQYLYEAPYNLRGRPWYETGKKSTVGATVWEQPYKWSGGQVGITAMRRVEAAGSFVGVLAADYELAFISEFLAGLDVPGAASCRVTNDAACKDKMADVFVMSYDGSLVGTNKGISVLNGDNVVKVSEVNNDVIKKVASDVFAKIPAFASATADWATVTAAIQRGQTVASHMGASKQVYWDAIGILDLRWIVVVTSVEDAMHQVYKSSKYQCVTKLICREVLLQAQSDLGERQVLHFRDLAMDYLSVPNTIINQFEASYNNGEMHGEFCSTCGALTWGDATHMSFMKKHMKSLMQIFTGPAWLYLGFNEQKVVGYRRKDNALQLWQTCEGTPEGCDTGSAFWADDARTSLVESKPADEFWTREWFLLPDKVNLGNDQFAWTKPYVFGDGDIGITLTKRLYAGDWKTTSPIGIVGADVTMKYFSQLVAGMDVQGQTVVYVYDKETMYLQAANRNIPTSNNGALIKATESSTYLVKESAKSLSTANPGPSSDHVYSVLGTNTTHRWVVRAMMLKDDDTAKVLRTFDYILVVVTPEEDLYDLTFSAAPAAAAASCFFAVAAAVAALVV